MKIREIKASVLFYRYDTSGPFGGPRIEGRIYIDGAPPIDFRQALPLDDFIPIFDRIWYSLGEKIKRIATGKEAQDETLNRQA